ncbi:putative amid-like NADH oxidoreductase [Talaromyces proteolyticus]|uniref:Amid-like NADH oxidoreductase n=1 Tax=Talaromyces proteolyticus TaxID=1131652 RepID=A0AAD4KTY5_9EURO|nr:putative amid-like NADH oxidoreductase [Talaromyces proteolyticus]KAH8699226.1 putative amid-like NADH oxidoreductase [Talaromyces proteolyticus]
MANDKLRLGVKIIQVLFPFAFEIILQRLRALAHSWTYRAVPDPKDIVVIGGSFTGIHVARRLTESIPTGYRVTMIERKSHFNYLFNFPRYSVLAGHEEYAFIPYDTLSNAAPEGSFRHMKDTVTSIKDGQVYLQSGETVDFAYLVIATGSKQSLPSKGVATEKEDGCRELQEVQNDIKAATRIAVVGGGAVGVEVATDIKYFYPEKEVTIVHSRDRLLHRFGPRLHEYVLSQMQEMRIHVRLKERPLIMREENTLLFSNGEREEYDLVLPCAGQTPNSAIIQDLAPSAISQQTREIRVKPTLQIMADSKEEDWSSSNTFAIGDVAATGGAKMARAAVFQAEVIVQNILAMISGKEASSVYKPRSDIEGSINLSLGKDHAVLYTEDDDGSDYLIPVKSGQEDLEIKNGWRMLGGKFPGNK